MRQKLPKKHKLALLIVENAATDSASQIVSAFDFAYEVDVVTEPTRGLASVRNRLLSEAEARNASILIGLDDDETASDDWATAYETALEQLPHCDVLMGWIEMAFEGERSPWMVPQDYGRRLLGQSPQILATTNYAMRRHVFCRVTGLGMRFDEKFNHSGGEDSDFFLRLREQSETYIGAVPKAKSTEYLPPDRSTFRAMVKRSWTQHVVYYRIITTKASGKRTISSMRKGYSLSLRFLGRAIYEVFHLFSGREELRIRVRRNLGRAVQRFVAFAAFFGYLFGARSTYYDPSNEGQDAHGA